MPSTSTKRPWMAASALVATALVAIALIALAWPKDDSRGRSSAKATEVDADEPRAERKRSSDPRVRYSEDIGLKLEDLAPPYGEEVSVEEQRESDSLLQQSADRMREIELRFQHELRDPEWAEPFSAQFRETLIGGGLHPAMLRSLECRTTMCRAQVLESDGTIYNAASQLLGGATRQAWIRWNDAAQGTLDVYVVRPGLETGTIYPPGSADI